MLFFDLSKVLSEVDCVGCLTPGLKRIVDTLSFCDEILVFGLGWVSHEV